MSRRIQQFNAEQQRRSARVQRAMNQVQQVQAANRRYRRSMRRFGQIAPRDIIDLIVNMAVEMYAADQRHR